MYFNVNFNVFFKLINLHLLVSELYLISASLSGGDYCSSAGA